MMTIDRPNKSVFEIVASRLPGLTINAVVLNLTAGTNYLKYWSVQSQAWVAPETANQVPEVIQGVYLLGLDHSAMSGASDDLYLVSVTEITTLYSDVFLVRFGNAIETRVLEVADYLVPARKEISRITDKHIRIAGFDSKQLGNEILRFDIYHDTSGVQPEETQVNTTSDIAPVQPPQV